MASSTTYYLLVFLFVAVAVVQAWPERQQERPERPQKGQLQNRRSSGPPNSFGEGGPRPINSFGEVEEEFEPMPAASGQQLQQRRGGPGGRPSFGGIGGIGDIDNEPSATGHHGHHNGRVQIKVYRGQSKGHGWDSFAPYGYWVRQPPDNHGHHGHY